MPRIETIATRMVNSDYAYAQELDERECGPEAEQLRARAGAQLYAIPELFWHRHMDTPGNLFPARKPKIFQRVRRWFIIRRKR